MTDKLSEVIMNPINLVPFADHSQKLPSKFLSPNESVRSSSTWKILAAHFFDFTFAFGSSTFMSVIFGQTVKSLLLTSGLRFAFSKQSFMPLEVTLLPVILISYFFVCHFMNHGQTLGMMIVKCRIPMKSQDFKEALQWAVHSTILCLSMGMSYFFTRKNWQSTSSHDYLYNQLMLTKEITPINLITKIAEFNSQEEEFEENYSQAA
jgi:hypothetical protein